MKFRLFNKFQNSATDDSKIKDKKKKGSVKVLELPLEANTHGYTATELTNYLEQEVIICFFWSYFFKFHN